MNSNTENSDEYWKKWVEKRRYSHPYFECKCKNHNTSQAYAIIFFKENVLYACLKEH